MVDPNKLMYWVDNWRESNPGKIDGIPLRLIATQTERRITKFWKKSIKNWIYEIHGTRLIVYKEFPLSPAVMKMGLSGHFLEKSGNPMHKKSIPMEQYAMYFLDNADPEWLKRNDYVLV